MIVLSVLSHNGAPVDPLEASFDELGGSIGRSPHNQLVLPDPEMTISRVHAEVVFRNGHYAIVDRGSNSSLVNNEPVGRSREQPLKPGDRLQIGGYVLQVRAGVAPANADPFADLFGPASAPPAQTDERAPAPTRATDLLRPVDQAIPADWNPFAPESPAPASTGPTDGPASDGPLGLGLGSASTESIDTLFGLSGQASGTDPLAGLGLTAPHVAPNTGGNEDPLRALAQAHRAVPLSAPDHGSELNVAWVTPAARVSTPPGAVLSWDPLPGEADRPTLPGALDASAWSPPVRTPAPAAGPIVAKAASPQDAEATPDALLTALCEGLGTPSLQTTALTPDAMRRIGVMLREATRGTVELLGARAALKREVRAEVTMIVARENNPLKFSPTVEVALQHLLGAPVQGFLPAEAAMRSAFDDLRAHELALMAGIRAALEGALKRFDPQQLESRIGKRVILDDLIPANRKARLWELFQELYTRLASEAADDFHQVFGKAFLDAYEEQLELMKRTRKE